MSADLLLEKARAYMRKLCVEIPSRRVGSIGNRAATDFFAGVVEGLGFETESPEFDCMDWEQDGVRLSAAGSDFEAFPSPHSMGCQINAPLVVVSTRDELQAAEISGRIVLARGELTREQLMPKNFPFYNPEEHRQIIGMLETKAPGAIIAATARDPEMAGGVYPFPLIEDGDFDIPSVYMTEKKGNKLAEHASEEITLELRARRIASKGCNVIARKGTALHQRMVFFAHIDAKMGAPGAIDNASGVVVMLLLAELLADHTGPRGIEIVALNGEDYYSAPGEQQYLALNAGKFDEILLGINVDGAGYCKGRVAYSLYDASPAVSSAVQQVFSGYQGMVEGPAWYQGDHGLFLLNQRPALAITSELLGEVMGITHTPQDGPEIVDPARLVMVAEALRDVVGELERMVEKRD